MDADRIVALLEPFMGDTAMSSKLATQLQAYLDLLLRWNARVNLTAVRDPEQIVTRHFGESLFAGLMLRDMGAFALPAGVRPTLADVGSGAGFPGIPIKLVNPDVQVTLIESRNKKATFLREVIRTIGIDGADVWSDRAANWNRQATIVTMRAVEKFKGVLPVAGTLVSEAGTLCLLISAGDAQATQRALGSGWRFEPLLPIPQSDGGVVMMARLGLKRYASRHPSRKLVQ